jgi:redox-sensitive bicupin YhaK (pirin superfamily)
MIQTWVALPEKEEEGDPSFTNYSQAELPVFTDKGVWMRLIAGDVLGLKNNVKTHSPLFYLHVMLDPNTAFGIPPGHAERGLYIAKGSIELSGTTYSVGQMLVFTKGTDPVICAKEPTTLMLLGGEPLGNRYIWWNFVSSRRERIEQAKADWKEGRIILPPNDNKEFIPLPEDKWKITSDPAPEPLS